MNHAGGMSSEPCEHGKRGEPCWLCEVGIKLDKLPAGERETPDELEIALRHRMRNLLMDATRIWLSNNMQSRWRGRHTAFLAWYLARRVQGDHGAITVKVERRPT